MTPRVVVLTAAAAAGSTAAAARILSRATAGRPEAWLRENHRGNPVALAAGPAAAVGVAAPLACVALLARRPLAAVPAGLVQPRVPAAAAGLALVTAAVGRYDDTVGARPDQRQVKGLRGHLEALRSGRVTAGAVKVAGIGAAAVGAAAVAGARGTGLVPAAVLVAGGANLANLFDLRPGRALKAVVLPALALAVTPPSGAPAVVGAATAGAAAALLPGDLRERTMLGDTGANALGAVLGLAVAVAPAPRLRHCALAVVLGLTSASEVVSFSRVIEATPLLAWVDRVGRLPAGP